MLKTPKCKCGAEVSLSFHDGRHWCPSCLWAEIERLRADWSYESLSTILRDALPLTMTLGLTKILVERMVVERMFAKRVGGVIAVVKKIAEEAAEAAKGK